MINFLYAVPVVFTAIKLYKFLTTSEDVKNVCSIYSGIRQGQLAPSKKVEYITNIYDAVKKTIASVINVNRHQFLGKMYGPVRVTDELVAVKYYSGNQWYQGLVYHHKKMSNKVIMKVTENDTDITHKLAPYLGPHENFYGHEITPKMLGYEHLTFHTMTANITIKTSTFQADHPIKIDA